MHTRGGASARWLFSCGELLRKPYTRSSWTTPSAHSGEYASAALLNRWRAISAALRPISPLIQSTQVPRWDADGKGEYRDEHLPDEDPTRYRRLQRSRTSRPEGRGLGRCNRLRAARGTRRIGAHFRG